MKPYNSRKSKYQIFRSECGYSHHIFSVDDLIGSRNLFFSIQFVMLLEAIFVTSYSQILGFPLEFGPIFPLILLLTSLGFSIPALRAERRLFRIQFEISATEILNS